MASSSQEAFVTLATNDAYAIGALVWAQSLRQVGTTRQLAILITPGVSQGMRESLGQVFDNITVVNILDSQDRTNLRLLARQDLGITFTKLHCWRLTQYSKAVFMDADTLVIQNIDDLFEREEFSAAPDPGWPDCFNSGVFVYTPSEETYERLLEFALTVGSFDGGDQGLLNLYFSNWATEDIKKHLPFVYNCVSQAFYSYLPAFKQFGKNVKVAHFIGAYKPWHYTYNLSTGNVDGDKSTGHSQQFLQRWWQTFVQAVQPVLKPGSKQVLSTTGPSEGHPSQGLEAQVENLRISSSGEMITYRAEEDPGRQYEWEQGQIDYLGVDKFDNIQKRLDQVITGPPPEEKKNPALFKNL